MIPKANWIENFISMKSLVIQLIASERVKKFATNNVTNDGQIARHLLEILSGSCLSHYLL